MKITAEIEPGIFARLVSHAKKTGNTPERLVDAIIEKQFTKCIEHKEHLETFIKYGPVEIPDLCTKVHID